MLQKVSLKPKKLKEYKNITNDKLYREITQLAKDLKGLKVLHINATKFGGGVAEILYSLIPLTQGLGIKAEWQTIVADDRLFEITKAFHNAFQGEKFDIDKRIERTYKRFNAYNAHLTEGEWDIIMIHDPQPAAIPYYLSEDKTKFIWRCHIDTSSPNKKMWKFFKPFLCEYSAAIFTSKEFAPKSFNLPIRKKYFVPPAIDPLSPKNKNITERMAKKILESFNVDANKPLVIQISRFDIWKDPIGVIKAYKIAKKKIPELQLVLAGSLAHDDPEGWKIYKKIEKYVTKDKNISLLSNLSNFGNIEVNVFQRASNIVLQKSIREGFGLTVSEAGWKGTPVIGSKVGGIKLQIIDGKTGYLVGNIKECADKIIYLLENPTEGEKLGLNAKKYIQKKFILPRLLRDHLRIYTSLVHQNKKSKKCKRKNVKL